MKLKFTPEFVQNIFNEFGRPNDYDLLDVSKVRGNRSKITVRHKKCGLIFDTPLKMFLYHSTGCPKCASNSLKFTKENFLNIWESAKISEDYQLIDFLNVKNSKSKFTIKHLSCGLQYNVSCNSFFHFKQRCPKCAGVLPKYTQENFLNIWNAAEQSKNYELVDFSKVVNQKSKFTIKHKICDFSFDTTCTRYFWHKNGCPKCSRSKGEDKISEILNKNNINFVCEHKINGCVRIFPLRFDFYLPDYNLLIEYQGNQHYRANPRWGGEDALKKCQESDAYKKKFALDNNYDFLEIPYWEFGNIEKILTDKLHL